MRLPPTLISNLKKYKVIQGVYLFGSQARFEAGPLSDIDICVVAPHCSSRMKLDILGYGSNKVDISFFDDLPLNIQVRVFKEGKLLFGVNQRVLDDLMWRTMKEYFDYEPHRLRIMEAYIPDVHHV